VALYEAPIYALICLAYFPVIFITIGLFGKKLKDASIHKLAMSKKLGGVVEENLSAIKLIVSFA
jgi:ABC-type transport system involved in cytochrome bd biosynthesis fused ATPase/permease subunit